MTSFTIRSIVCTQTIGERLRKAREGCGISLESVARQIRVRHAYLACIEQGAYSNLPGEVYALEYIKHYARFLRMDPDAAARAYRAECTGAKKQQAMRQSTHTLSYARLLSGRGSNPIVRGMAALAAAAALWYAGVFLQQRFAAPELEVFSPAPYTRSATSGVQLRGRAVRAEAVFVNREQVSTDEAGEFAAFFYVPAGVSVLTVSARGRRGNVTTQYVVVDVSS